MAGLTALAAALTVFVAIVSTLAAWNYRTRPRPGRDCRIARPGPALGSSLISEGAARQLTGLIGQRFDSLDRLERAAEFLGADIEGRNRLPEIRDHAIAAMALTDLRVRGNTPMAICPRLAAMSLSSVCGRRPLLHRDCVRAG